MKTYQGLFIFPATLAEERMPELIEAVKSEIAKLKGQVLDTISMDKRTFARRLHKQEAGRYLKMLFQMDPAGVGPFQARLRLMDGIFRVQIVSMSESALRKAKEAAAPKPATAGGESEHHA